MASRIEQLKGVLGTLASSPEVQIEHLRNLFGDEAVGEQFPTDELALEFGDVFSAGRDMVCAGELRPDQLEAAGRVDELLTTMSDGPMAELWTVAALHSHPRWRAVRELAKRALALFP